MNGLRFEGCLGRVDARRPAVRDQVRGDRRDGAGDRGRRRATGLLDGEVVGQRDRLAVADALDADLLDVRAPLGRADAASADVRRREPARRDRPRHRASNGSSRSNPSSSRTRIRGRLVGRVADLEHDVRGRRSYRGSVTGSGCGTRWTSCSPYGSGKAKCSSPVNDGCSTGRPPSHTIDVPVLASKRVTTMPGDVHIGCVMYEYIRMASTDVELVGAEPREDVGQTGRDAAAGDDPASGRLRRVVPLELLRASPGSRSRGRRGGRRRRSRRP